MRPDCVDECRIEFAPIRVRSPSSFRTRCTRRGWYSIALPRNTHSTSWNSASAGIGIRSIHHVHRCLRCWRPSHQGLRRALVVLRTGMSQCVWMEYWKQAMLLLISYRSKREEATPLCRRRLRAHVQQAWRIKPKKPQNMFAIQIREGGRAGGRIVSTSEASAREGGGGGGGGGVCGVLSMRGSRH